MQKFHLILGVVIIALVGGFFYHMFVGAGAFKRHFTMSGVYAVCKPGGYDVVCFLDADGKEGGMSCLPLEFCWRQMQVKEALIKTELYLR